MRELDDSLWERFEKLVEEFESISLAGEREWFENLEKRGENPEVIARLQRHSLFPDVIARKKNAIGGKPTGAEVRSADQSVAPGAPQTFGHYRVIAKLGEGGFGTVFRAFDSELNRDVAIKVIRTDRLRPEVVSQFDNEISTLAKLKPHGIVHIYGAGKSSDGQRYFVMEYVKGTTLKELIKPGSSPPDLTTIMKTTDIMIQVAGAVHRLHRTGIVHRDLKPGNILIDEEGNPYVADLGLAVTVADLHEGAVSGIGTVRYMSPEQVRECQGRGRGINTRSDIWSLGVVLYEVVTGKRPFGRISDSNEAIMDAIENDVPPPPRNLNPNVPDELDAIIRKCLKKDQDERYQTAEELASALEKWLNLQFPPAVWNVPGYVPFFTGREQYLNRIHEVLRAGKIAVLTGKAGIGKTQTARKYAHMHRADYPTAFWANASAIELLVSHFVAIARDLQLPGWDDKDQNLVASKVVRWLFCGAVSYVV